MGPVMLAAVAQEETGMGGTAPWGSQTPGRAAPPRIGQFPEMRKNSPGGALFKCKASNLELTPEIEPGSLALEEDSLPTELQGKPSFVVF